MVMEVLMNFEVVLQFLAEEMQRPRVELAGVGSGVSGPLGLKIVDRIMVHLWNSIYYWGGQLLAGLQGAY
jgi:hypothetical protein